MSNKTSKLGKNAGSPVNPKKYWKIAHFSLTHSHLIHILEYEVHSLRACYRCLLSVSKRNALKNDINFRLNLSVTSNVTIQRKIDNVNTITNGNVNIQIRPNISYVVNSKLNIQLYVNRNVTDPLVTNSYRRATTQVGTKILFNLAQ